ncbi:MAG TPA: hypothetical protein VFA57_07845 [Pseudolabrys sp.]|nr:hypothetical protein [Pseudolabrys sp.]
MKKIVILLGLGLIAAPLPTWLHGAAAQTAQSTTTAKPKKAPSAGLAAMHERQKKCGAEWKEAKAAGKVEKGMTWPKYWSACNKRLKEMDAKKS